MHRPETGDPGPPDLIPPSITTPATPPDCVLGPTRVHELAARDLLPGTHSRDSGDVAADFLVPAQPQPQGDVVGPALGSSSRPHQPGPGDDLQAFVVDGEAQQARGKAMRASTGGRATMSRALPSSASALTEPAVARGPPARRAPRRKAPRVHSRSAPTSTTRPARPPANGRSPPRSKPRTPCGPGWSVASRKARGALTGAAVAPSGGHARTASRSSQPRPCMWFGGSPGCGVRRWASVGGRRATLPNGRRLPSHLRRCAVKEELPNRVCRDALCGSIRRELLDQVIVLNEQHLIRLLHAYMDYYHSYRNHRALDVDAPIPRPVQPPELGRVREVPEVHGLHHHYELIAA